MYTPIKLDKTRNFRYGMKALNLIEKKFNKNIASIDFENLTIEETMTIIWAGLVHEDKDLTPEALIDIIDNNGIKLETIVTAMSEALQDAFGSDEVKEPKNTKATVE
jgi:hypothetical protein